MTCIVAIETDDGSVVIGGDSAGVTGLDIHIRRDEKVFQNGPMIMGICGSFRMGQLLRYAVAVPDHDPRTSDMQYMVLEFVDAMRDSFKEKGILRKTEEVEEYYGSFLIGYKGKLYLCDADFQIGRVYENYSACGCGGSYALGVLHDIKKNDPKCPPIEAVTRALDAATFHSGGVAKPYTILTLEPDGEVTELTIT